MKRVVCLLSLLLAAAVTAQAQKRIADEELDRATGTRVQVRSVFDPLPPSGYAPMRVVATNGTSREGRWTFSFHSQISGYRNENKHGSSFALDLPARSTQSALMLVPLAVSYGGGGYGGGGYGGHALRLEISGTGFEVKDHFDHDNRVGGFPAVAISAALAEYSIAGLNKEMQSKRSSGGSPYYGARTDLFGSQFEPEDLPDSWLGFSGFDFVLLASTDWQKLKPQVRRALLDWTRFGGELHVFLSSGVTPESLGVPEVTSPGKTRMSMGGIQTFGWDGKKLPASETVSRYWGVAPRVEDLTLGHSNLANWPLLVSLGQRSFASWQVMVFLVVFGVLVGPVNLFVLAPAGRRHRLFVTTPLLSVGASVVMVGLILLQDGTGGMGRRFIAVNLEPEDAAAYVTQEQVSRTGVLFGAGFQMKQPALVEPVAMPSSAWAKLKNDSFSQPVDLTQEGRERRGNYFQSRAEQGQVIRAVVPTRARVELKAGTAADEPPVLISALGFTVDELYYVDAAGVTWQLEKPLSTGQSATLVKSDIVMKNPWITPKFAAAEEGLLREINNAASGNRAWFVAKAGKAPDFVLETLPAIRWQQDQILVFGPVAQP
ncbi:MAG TPA: hypothetical protein VGE39_03115 [Prosthecobacter sp.]